MEEEEMKLWNKKETIELYSESQKDNMIERLESAHVNFQIQEVENLFTAEKHFNISVDANDMKKIA